MKLDQLRPGMVLHHSTRTEEDDKGAVSPWEVTVGGIKSIRRNNYMFVQIRHGLKTWGRIFGSKEEVEEELSLWHEGNGRECQECNNRNERLHDASVIEINA